MPPPVPVPAQDKDNAPSAAPAEVTVDTEAPPAPAPPPVLTEALVAKLLKMDADTTLDELIKVDKKRRVRAALRRGAPRRR